MKKFFTLLMMALMAVNVNAGETVLWEGEVLVNGWANQPTFLSDGGAELKALNAAAGDLIRVYGSAPDKSWQVEVFDGHWGKNFQCFSGDVVMNEDGSTKESIVVDLATVGYFDFTISEEFLTAATTSQGWGGAFILNGDGNLTVTKVTLVSDSEVQPSESYQTDLSLSGWYPWNTEVITTNEDGSMTVEFAKEWGGVATWIATDAGPFDASKYDYIVLEIEPTTVMAQIWVEFSDKTNETAQIPAGSTSVKLALNPEKKTGIQQIAVQTDLPGVVVIKRVYWEGSAAAPAGDLWTVAGNFVGSSWNPEDASNDMTLEGELYTLVKTDVTLEKGTSYEFKVVKDHAWAEAYPGSNYTFTVDETGIYTVTVTFNAETKEINVTTVKTGEAGAVEHAYSVMGTLGGDSWTVDNDMTKGEDGIYTVTFDNVAAGNYEFKVRVDHDWSVAYPGSNYQLTVDQDGSKVVITFNEETKEVNATVTAPTGIATIKAETTQGKLYNVAGQKVDANYKGIVIVNGKKVLMK